MFIGTSLKSQFVQLLAPLLLALDFRRTCSVRRRLQLCELRVIHIDCICFFLLLISNMQLFQPFYPGKMV